MEKGEKTATHPHTNKRANSTTQQQTTWNIVPISDQRTDEQTNKQPDSGKSSTNTSTYDFREYGNTEKKL